MRMFTFTGRCAKEILRDPLNLMFGLGFPIVVLLLLSAIQANIPIDLFQPESLTPGITVFGLSFMTLFSATLIAKDRESSLLQRLYTTPLTATDFIMGYMIPLIPIAIAQGAACYVVAFFLGLPLSIHVVYAILAIVPIAILYIAIGLLCGSVCNVKQVGGICGALLTNLSAWLSGVWFDLDLAGEGFGKIANVLPFVHAVEFERSVLNGNFAEAMPHIYPILAYAAAIMIGAVLLFLRQMKKQ
ncbi:MAG: ABC transporter permease [Clostridia bacterium]|nr:ABC transporter permease [Clostridia bacterium]